MQPPYLQKEDKIAEIVLAQQQSLQIKKNRIIRLLYIVGGSIAYISPQKNRAVKNKSYFYNCYGKEEEFHIKNQG